MRKIYSLVLMATMLLVGTNLWAQANGKIKIVRTGVEYEHLQDAFTAALDGDVLELTDNMTEAETKAAWFGESTSGTLENYASTDRSITLDLKGHTYYNSTARFIIALTRGQLRIKSTGGEGTINLKKHGIAVYGTYLKIDAKNQTPFSHLIIEENVKIKSNSDSEGDKAIVLTVMDPEEVTGQWKWEKSAEAYPLDYCCEIFPKANYGVANGARIDIYGKVDVKEYALQVTGNVRSALEYLNEDGSYNTSMGVFPFYYRRSETELFLPGTTMENKTEVPHEGVYTQRILKYNYFVGGNGDDTQDPGEAYNYAYRDNGSNDYVLTSDDNNYAPYIHIHPSAELKVNNPASKEVAGFYSAGYSRVYIEGTVEGSTGVYVKSGDVELHDATITSNYSGDYAAANPTNSGVNAGGSGIVIESNATYTGSIGATVSGDTYVEGSTGYAIDEAVTNAPTTDVDIIDIQGGTFVGGNQGTISISEETADANLTDPEDVQIIIAGGNITNGDATIGTDDLEDFLNSQTNDTHITIVDGTMVVSQGGAPAEDPDNVGHTTWAFIASQSNSANPPSYAWTAVEQNQQISSGTIYLGELQINSGSAGNLQELIIHDGATLQVERLIMNAYARIIVEAGGKLIVKGTQGISAPSINNILLKNEENKPAVFLFHPNVNSNKHPNGTVEFTSKGFNNTATSTFGWQKFGVPTQTGELSEIIIDGNIPTAFGKFNYAAETPAWEVIGYLNHTPALVLGDLDQAFEYYQMEHNTATVGTKVTFKGKLVGNDCPAPVIRPNFWNGYANSYSAPIDGAALLALIPAPADKAFYLYEQDVLTLKFAWVAQSNLHLNNIQPMQPFLLRNPSADDAALALNYAAAVYTPATTPNNAPARRVADDMTKVEFVVRGENGVDHVIVAQDDEFSDAFDNGYDVTKYMNDDVNMYVTADEKMAIFATDNLENTYVGFSTVKGGNYTITFANVQGEELTLIDHETGAQVAMVEGNTYEFTAAANATNDYRFEVVGAAKMPTAIENAEAVKSVKGIYTITGQYLGEMSVWNSLPAGVYVVNGEKRVK